MKKPWVFLLGVVVFFIGLWIPITIWHHLIPSHIFLMPATVTGVVLMVCGILLIKIGITGNIDGL